MCEEKIWFDTYKQFLCYKFCAIFTWQEVGNNALARLKYTSNLEDLRFSDIVIEAIVESEDVKKELFIELDKIVKESAILASNTSSISITRLATATKRPHQVSFNIWSFCSLISTLLHDLKDFYSF